jgi:hypothetical protein
VPSKDTHYRSYLLRIWRDDAFSPWRALVQNPATGERHAFSSLAQLYAFLEHQAAAEPGTAGLGQETGPSGLVVTKTEG